MDLLSGAMDHGMRPGKVGQIEEAGIWWSGRTKKEMEPSRARIQTSSAPASKYKVRFSFISEGELEGERASMQISGASGRRPDEWDAQFFGGVLFSARCQYPDQVP